VRLTFAFIAVLAALCAPTRATAAERIPIYVVGSSKDTVGTTYIYTLKEQLKASRSYDVVPAEKDAVFKISIATLDRDLKPNAVGTEISTVASIVLVVNGGDKSFDYFVDHWAVIAGKEKVAESVTDIIAGIDKSIQDIFAALQKK